MRGRCHNGKCLIRSSTIRSCIRRTSIRRSIGSWMTPANQHSGSSIIVDARSSSLRFRSRKSAEDQQINSRLFSTKAKGSRLSNSNMTLLRSSMNFGSRWTSGADCQETCGRSHTRQRVFWNTGVITRSAMSALSSARWKQLRRPYGSPKSRPMRAPPASAYSITSQTRTKKQIPNYCV